MFSENLEVCITVTFSYAMVPGFMGRSQLVSEVRAGFAQDFLAAASCNSSTGLLHLIPTEGES